MYFYIYAANNNIHNVIVDDFGVPEEFSELAPVGEIEEGSPVKDLTENSNLIIFGQVLDPIQVKEGLETGKTRRPVNFYYDTKIADKIETMKTGTDEDWMNFFDELNVPYEISKSEKKYLLQ